MRRRSKLVDIRRRRNLVGARRSKLVLKLRRTLIIFVGSTYGFRNSSSSQALFEVHAVTARRKRLDAKYDSQKGLRAAGASSFVRQAIRWDPKSIVATLSLLVRYRRCWSHRSCVGESYVRARFSSDAIANSFFLSLRQATNIALNAADTRRRSRSIGTLLPTPIALFELLTNFRCFLPSFFSSLSSTAYSSFLLRHVLRRTPI